jgi:ATP-dependent RNA helicase DeaD
MHSDLSQDERTSVIDAFRAGRARVLVTTDLCARGLDVTGVVCLYWCMCGVRLIIMLRIRGWW